MEYRLLGRSGLKVSALSLGTMTFGRNSPDKPLGSVGPDEARRHIDLCIDHGVNLIDTANVYTSGQSEEIIGEAVAHLPDDLKARYPAIPWAQINGLRNQVVHQYFGLSWHSIWDTASLEVPVLRKQIAEILRAEFPES